MLEWYLEVASAFGAEMGIDIESALAELLAFGGVLYTRTIARTF
jgi:hypothetical protein